MTALPTLVEQLAALAQRELRAQRAAEALRSAAPEEAVQWLEEVCARASQRDAGLPWVLSLEAALGALHGALEEEVIAALRSTARRASAGRAHDLLSAAEPLRAFDRDREPWVDKAMRARTLGERKQLARSRDRDQLSRLLQDQDAPVLRNLLQNPRLTEADVIRAAARRPTRPAVLEEIFRSPRFGHRRGVRRALAQNPYTAPALACAALALLTAADLREIARNESLSPQVRLAAKERLAQRPPPTDDEPQSGEEP